MITPNFTITQDFKFITIIIKTPYIKVSDVELYCEGPDFSFYVKPYYLRLHFPGNLVDDDRVNASYDISSGEMNIKIPKETPGEEFSDLDLLTKLLAPKSVKKVPEKPLIEIIDDNNDENNNQENDNELEELFEKEDYRQKSYKNNNDFLIRELNNDVNNEVNDVNDVNDNKPLIQELFGGKINDDKEAKRLYKLLEEADAYNWELPQQIPNEKELLPIAKYGFNKLYSGYFMHIQETCNEIIDITDPERSTPESRRQDRINTENSKFDPDHYIADFMCAQDIKHLIKSKNVWWKGSSDLNFTEEENTIMRNLTNKQYLIENVGSIYYGLIDLLFAYSYNYRVFEGENTVESPWMIGKISPTISCLEQFNSIEETMKALYRRSLAYPWYRNYKLAKKCQEDVYDLLKLGKRAILKVLLELKDLFDHHDTYYVYSKIWLDDYCIWCQTKASDKIIRSLAHKLHHHKVLKSDTGWHLEEYEHLALEDAQEKQAMDLNS
ncbi:SHQ1 domain-containing protein [Rhizophagus diaphanus]|nr:SHQ1 domain-containing protein [Rhizophagus diaphanus] [Rhizophagus sp. MUCL 43196]